MGNILLCVGSAFCGESARKPARNLSGPFDCEPLALVSASGHRVRWSPQDDRAAVNGNSPRLGNCREDGFPSRFMDLWFQVAALASNGIPEMAVLGDYLSAKGNAIVAIDKLDRPLDLGKICRYLEDSGRVPSS